MLVKLTTGLNFINFLHTAFMLVGPKSVRIQSSSQYLFTLLGSTGAKAARRTLMKLTPDRHQHLSTLSYYQKERWTLLSDSLTNLLQNLLYHNLGRRSKRTKAVQSHPGFRYLQSYQRVVESGLYSFEPLQQVWLSGSEPCLHQRELLQSGSCYSEKMFLKEMYFISIYFFVTIFFYTLVHKRNASYWFSRQGAIQIVRDTFLA